MPIEERYVIFKLDDLRKWSKGSLVQDLFSEYMAFRVLGQQKPPLKGVFVEADWPEYDDVVEDIMKRIGAPATDDAIETQPVVTQPAKHSHYFKDVSQLQFVDVYRVLKLFSVTDPCLQHAIKKLLVAGGRGAGKSIERDLQEAIDSINRALQMIAEDNGS